MTIRIPKQTLGDRILKVLSKKRGLILPSKEMIAKYGGRGHFLGQKESFIKALFRARNKKLPENMIDIDNLKQ